jgi:pyruvate,water dikinase
MIYVEKFETAVPNLNLVGGKASNLIEMIRKGLEVPPGFIVNTKAFNKFLKDSKLKEKISLILSNNYKPNNILTTSAKIEEYFQKSHIPSEIIKEIKTAFTEINDKQCENTSYCVRSSANIEDSYKYSFAGQAESVLNLTTFEEILMGIKKCWISLYSPNSLLYILQMRKKGLTLSLRDLNIAVIIQKMIFSEISGVLFTVNVINNSENEMLINSTWGIGDTITSNLVIPDMIIIRKDQFSILKYVIGEKEKKSIINSDGCSTIIVPTEKELRIKRSLDDSQIFRLYNLGLKLEKDFNYPQDIEWALENNILYVLQTRPITTISPLKSEKF